MPISFFYSIVKSVRFTAPHDAAKFLYSNSNSNDAAYDKKYGLYSLSGLHLLTITSKTKKA